MSAEAYVELIYLRYVLSGSFDKDVGESWTSESTLAEAFNSAMQKSFDEHGYSVGNRYSDLVDRHYRGVVGVGAIAFEGDEFTGKYALLSVPTKDAYVKSALEGNAVFARIERLGEGALARALAIIAEQEGWLNSQSNPALESMNDELEPPMELPASDRTVTLGHNHSSQFVEATEELISEVEQSTNSFDGDVGLRAQIIGQLKAAKELLLVGVFKLRAIQTTLLESLEFLANRYEKETIGALASALLAEVLKVLFS